MIEIRPATAEALRAFYGNDIPRTVKAFVAMKDERIIGAAGVYADVQRVVVFARLTDELRSDKRAVIKGIRKIKTLIPEGLPAHAVADPEIEGSERLLTHMGFSPLSSGVYEWIS